MTPQARDNALENALEFDQEQSALLELLSAQINDDQDGEFDTYGYVDVDSQANGFFPDDNLNYTDTYPFAELSDGCRQDQQGEDPAISALLATGPAGYEQTLEADIEHTSDFEVANFTTGVIGYAPDADYENASELEIAHLLTGPDGYEHIHEADLENTSEHGAAQFAMGPAAYELTPEADIETTFELEIPQSAMGPAGYEKTPEAASEYTPVPTPPVGSEHRAELDILQNLACYGSIINPINLDGLAGEGDNPKPNNAFTGPLEAAAAVGIRADIKTSIKSFEKDDFFVRTFTPDASPKRLREVNIAVHTLEGHGSYGHKRQKTASPCKSPEALALGLNCGSVDDRDKGLSLEPGASDTPKKVGKHVGTSHIFLYKEPEKPARKYSRPANSIIFSSLELQLQTFLYLQAAVKDYMLDPDHPERMACVGVKGKHESDAVKLKLYGAVNHFLKNEGWGDRCFGSGAQDFETRKLRWPEHEYKVIELLTPLMRKMVSNERQRLYAVEKRIATMGGKPRTPSSSGRESLQPHTPQADDYEDLMSFDNNFDQCDFSLASSASTVDEYSPPKLHFENSPGKRSRSDESELRYHINIMKDGRRIQPKVVLTPLACPGFSYLTQHISSLIDDLGQRVKRIQVLGPGSLLEARDEVTWKEAIDSIRQSEWMDGDVKCVAEVAGIV